MDLDKERFKFFLCIAGLAALVVSTYFSFGELRYLIRGRTVDGEIARAAIVTQQNIPYPVDPGIEHRTFLIGDGEPAKSLTTIEELCRGFAQWGLTRVDCIVAVGGGVVTDVAGFAASAYHRGIPFVSVPTTLPLADLVFAELRRRRVVA